MSDPETSAIPASIKWARLAYKLMCYDRDFCAVINALSARCDARMKACISMADIRKECQLTEHQANGCIFYLIHSGLLQWVSCGRDGMKYRLVYGPRVRSEHLAVVVVVRT